MPRLPPHLAGGEIAHDLLGPGQVGVGTMIVYATVPDSVTLEGKGRNSPFATSLLKHLKTPGLDIELVIRRVRTDVMAAPHGMQIPWYDSMLAEDVILAHKSPSRK